MMSNFGGWAIDQKVFDWILENIEPGSTILELGSGRGTVELVKRYEVFSVEHNKSWLGYTNSNYIYSEIRNGWYDLKKEDLPENYSLLIIDGPPGHIGRGGFLKNLHLFNLDTTILVDDTHRRAEREIANELIDILDKEVIEIKSIDKKTTILL